MPDEKPSLDAAYALETPEDNRRLYADWAETYDDSFAQQMDYRLPRMVALILAEVFQGPGPVLDVGAGTGLVAQNMLMRGMLEIDALDISADMLAVAASKGLYRKTIEADLTGPLDLMDGVYGAVVSAGTFTHGHVGPDALDELLRVARKGAVFVLSINAEHFEARGFAEKFAALAGRIDGLEHREVDIYGAAADAAHAGDKAQITVFTKR
ncbi:class I SAM-dependent methyltransferase [Marimonas sp. MJW-29]|uniref:Class I SAM-dependent methyltransferase n=1 Tax=Sulfitobacter sediminis TaxID=3234186 RepID=A0ABV3RN06_9RHOB